MRISSSTLYDVNVAALNTQQAKLLHTQQQIAAQRRILTPADDPAAAALALEVSQSDSANAQHGSNIDRASTALALSEGVLQSVTALLQDVQTATVAAANSAALSDSDRRLLASDLQSRLDELIVLANHTDATGNYLFSGNQGSTAPFVTTASGVQYMGDDGKRMVQVSTAGQVVTNSSGADIFMRTKNGNGTFFVQADPTSNFGAGNAGSGLTNQGLVINPALLTGNNYQMTFSISAGATTYSVVNTTTSTTVVASAAYASGQPITFDGMQFAVTGTPANGDQFTITPSSSESVFKTISDLIAALNTGIVPGSVSSATQMSANINRALNNLNRDLDSVLMVRASMGSRLRQLDSEKSTVEDLGLQYQSVLSQLQDLDFNKAATDLARQKTSLEAAQKSFLQIQSLSIFNYM